MNKAVFLDRDGTINIDKGYLYRIEDFEFLPGAIEGLRKLQEAGYLLIIITNQSGIARGYYTEEDFIKLNEYMKGELKKEGITITEVYYCPHYGNDCECRKPKTAMFERAVREFNIDLSKSYAIGDKERDCSICFKSECRGFLIGHDSPDARIRSVKSLKEAAEKITEVRVE